MGNIDIIVGRSGEYSHTFAKCGINVMNNLNISFTGEYQYAIDNKGRLNIPAKFRKALHPDNDRTFVITRGFDPCLLVYPIEEWRTVEQQLSLLSSIKNKDRSFVRSVVRYATYSQYDGQGRIQIPDNLVKFGNIKKDVIIIGMIKKIELWNPNELENIDRKNTKNDDNNFEDLANEINF